MSPSILSDFAFSGIERLRKEDEIGRLAIELAHSVTTSTCQQLYGPHGGPLPLSKDHTALALQGE